MEIILKEIAENLLDDLFKNIALNTVILDFKYLKDDNSNKYYKVYDLQLTSQSPTIRIGKRYYFVKGKVQLSNDNKCKIKADYTLKSNLKLSDIKNINQKCNCGNNVYYILSQVNNVNNLILKCEDCFKSTKELLDVNKIPKLIKDTINKNVPVLNRYELKSYLEYVCNSVEKYGWTGTCENKEENTAINSWCDITMGAKLNKDYSEKVNDLINTFKDIPDTSDFIKSLKHIIKKNIISYKDKNVASFIYKIGVDIDIKKSSDWFGKIGDKVEAVISLISIKKSFGDYGDYRIYNFSYEGKILYAFSSKIYDIYPNQKLILNFEVLKHDEYFKNKTTKVKIISVKKLLDEIGECQ